MQIVMKQLSEEEAMAIIDIRQQEAAPCILEFERADGTIVEFADLQLCAPLLVNIGGQIVVQLADGTVITPPTSDTIDERDTEFVPPERFDDPACVASANAMYVLYTLHGQVMQTVATPSLITIAAVIAGLLIALLFMPVATAIILALLAGGLGVAFFGVITTLPPSAFSASVQCTLQMILFDNSTDVDGVVTFDYTTVLADVTALASNNIWTCIQFYLTVIGENGLNRAGATTALATADCSGCQWCYEWSSLADMVEDGFSLVTNLAHSKLISTATSWRLIDVQYEFSASETGSGTGLGIWRDPDATDPLRLDVPIDGATSPFAWTGDNATAGLALGGNTNTGGSFTMSNIRIAGIGQDPGFTHGTPC